MALSCSFLDRSPLPAVREEPFAAESEQVVFGDEDLADGSIIIGCTEYIVHKMALASRSDVFREMFYGENPDTSRVEVRKVPSVGFRRLLELLYCGDVSDKDRLLDYDTCYDDRNFHQKNLSLRLNELNFVKFTHKSQSAVEELRAVAEDFNLSRMVEEWLEVAVSRRICTAARCHECIKAQEFAYEIDCELNPNQKKGSYFCLVGFWPKMSQSSGCAVAGDLPTDLHFGDFRLSDVCLRVGKHNFYVHRQTLASRSKKFRELFYERGGQEAGGTLTVESKFVSSADLPRTFKRLLEVVYEGRVADPEVYFDYRYCRDDPAFKLHNPRLRGNEKNFIKFTSSHSNATGTLHLLSEEFGLKDCIVAYQNWHSAHVVCRATGCQHCRNAIKFAQKESLEIHTKKMIKNRKKKTYIRPTAFEIEERLLLQTSSAEEVYESLSCDCTYCELLS